MRSIVNVWTVVAGLLVTAPAGAVPPPDLPLPPCDRTGPRPVGACARTSTVVELGFAGRIAEGGTVPLTLETTLAACDSWTTASNEWDPSPCYSGATLVTEIECVYIDLTDEETFKETQNCHAVLFDAAEAPQQLWTLTSTVYNGSNQPPIRNCSAYADFARYAYGGPGGDLQWRWAARGQQLVDCLLGYAGPRPDALYGPTWLKLSTHFKEERSGSTSHFADTDVYVPIDGDMRIGPGEVELTKVEPVQAIFGSALVAGKPTTVAITVDSTFEWPVPVVVEVTSTAGAERRLRTTALVRPGLHRVVLGDLTFRPTFSGQIRVAIDPDDTLTAESTNETLTVDAAVTVLDWLSVAYVPLRWEPHNYIFDCGPIVPAAGADYLPPPDQRRELQRHTDAYLSAILPVPWVRSKLVEPATLKFFSVHVSTDFLRPNSVTHCPQWTVDRAIVALAKWTKIMAVDRVVGVMPYVPQNDGPKSIRALMGEVLIPPTSGQTFRGDSAVVVDGIVGREVAPKYRPGVVAHEIGHTFGLPLAANGAPGNSGEEYNQPAIHGRPASAGVWIDPDRVYHPAGWVEVTTDLVPNTTMPVWWSMMGTTDIVAITDKTWIAQDDYDHLFTAMQGGRDPPAYMVSGWVDVDGTAGLEPLVEIRAKALTPPAADGTHELVVFDAEGVELSRLPMTPSSSVRVDSESADIFVVTIRRVARAARLELRRRDQTVLAERTASANPPVVDDIVFPGGALVGGARVPVEVVASDPDGDRLNYFLMYSDDDATWAPISLTSASSTATWTVPRITTDRVRVRVLVTDGFTTTAYEEGPVTIDGPDDGPLVAHAGADRVVEPGARVAIDASTSSDPRGRQLRFAWSVLAYEGSDDFTLSDATSAIASFEAAAPGRYFLELVVAAEDERAVDRVAVTVRAGPDARCRDVEICAGEAADVDAGSSHVDGLALDLVQTPAGPYTALGSIEVTLTADDGELTSTCSARVLVADCGTNPSAGEDGGCGCAATRAREGHAWGLLIVFVVARLVRRARTRADRPPSR